MGLVLIKVYVEASDVNEAQDIANDLSEILNNNGITNSVDVDKEISD